MKKALLCLAAASLSNGAAFAGTMVCQDNLGRLKYEKYSQDGGPCCGRSSSRLTLDGRVIKETQTIGPSQGGMGGSATDSNPSLSILERNQQDYSRRREGPYILEAWSEELILSNLSGLPIADQTFYVSCTARSSAIPIP